MTDTSPPSNSLWTRLIADAHRAVRAVVDVRRQIGIAVVLSISAGALWVGGVEARAAMRRLFERSSDQAAQVSPSTGSSQHGGGNGTGTGGGFGQGGSGSGTAGSGSGAIGAIGAGGSVVFATWGDTLTHYVLLTDVAADAPTPESTTPTTLATAPTSTAIPTPPAVSTAGQSTSGASTMEVVHVDGSSAMMQVPPKSLRMTIAMAPEQALVAEHNNDPVQPIVVVDDQGVLGAPGHRYVQAMGRLIDTGVLDDGSIGRAAPNDTTSATTPSATSDNAAPDDSVTDTDERAVIARLEHTPGVMGVTHLTPGMVQVSTNRPMPELVSIAGVRAVRPDSLLVPVAVAASPSLPSVHEAETASPTPRVLDSNGTVTPVVAIIDSGFDLGQPSFAASAWVNHDETCGNGIDDDNDGLTDDCIGWDFGGNDADVYPEPLDPNRGHGSAVMNVLLRTYGQARGDSESGIRVMPLKVSRARGTVPMSSVAAAIDYAVAHGADVVNVSLITPAGTTRDEAQILEDAIANAEDNNVLVVAAAGNDRADITVTPTWPASFATDHDNVITVGAIAADGTRATFSNSGTAITLYAPGVDVEAASSGSATPAQSGTSFAAPAVAADVAQLVANAPSASLADRRAQVMALATEGPAGPTIAQHLPPVASASPVAVGAPSLNPIAPVLDGKWHVTDVPMRHIVTSGGVTVRLVGNFPVHNALTVSLVQHGATIARIPAASYGEVLEFTVPATAATGLVDVVVEFDTNRLHRLQVARALALVSPQSPDEPAS